MEHFPSLAAKRRAAQSAQAATSKFDTEEKVLQHLLDTKPSILCCGKELKSDNRVIEDNLSAYIERFIRKGLVERSERLDYLQKTLRQKYGDETQKFCALMGFLLSMEEDSTNVESEVEIGAKEYSSLPDAEQDVDLEKKLEEESELKQRILEEMKAEREEVVYSSDSELSDWDSGGEDAEKKEEVPQKPLAEIKPPDKSIISVRDTRRRGSGMVKVESNEEWNKRVQTAADFMKEKFPHRVVTLSQQPVISSHIDLHLKFGLFWEWKSRRATDNRGTTCLEVISEARIIREVVCHFMSPFTENSVIFSKDSPSRDYMLPTLSRVTLNSFLKKYARIPTAVQKLKTFIKTVHENSLLPETDNYPKIIRAFAHSISEVLRYVSACVGQITDPVKGRGDQKANAVSTLLQMDRKLRKAVDLVLTVEHVFVQCIGDFDSALNFDLSDSWIVSEKMMAALEMAVRMESRTEDFIVTVFIFSQCLTAYLEDFMVTLEKDVWPEVSIFSRNDSVRLSDSNFWKASVTLKPYEEKVEGKVFRISFLPKIAPRMLMFLKTLEMIRQLHENTSAVVGTLPSAEEIVTSFLAAFLPDGFPNVSRKDPQDSTRSSFPEYERYFNFMKVDDKRVFGSFQYLVAEQRKQSAPSPDLVGYPLINFLHINEVPSVDTAVVLPAIVTKYLGPVLVRGESSLKAILVEYKVQESLALFQEIILGGREDFAQAVVKLASQSINSKRFKYEDPGSRDVDFQKLLSDFYPEGRETFDIELRLDPSSDLRFNLEVKAKFPINLVLTPETINKYLFISQQLFRMRKSIWNLNNLQMKDCCPGPGVDIKRALMLRFALIHFCSSIRSFFMFKIFSANGGAWEINEDRAFEEILQAHEEYLTRIETRLLKTKLMGNFILKNIVAMSNVFQKCWAKEVQLPVVLRLEEHLKNCWGGIQDYCKMFVGQEFSQLEYFTGPAPSFL